MGILVVVSRLGYNFNQCYKKQGGFMSLVLSIFLGVGYPVIFLAGIRLGRKRTEAKIYKKFFVPGEKFG